MNRSTRTLRRVLPQSLLRKSLEQLEARETPALFNVLSPVAVGSVNNFGSVATGDFNGDGNADIVMTNYGLGAPGTNSPGKTILVKLGNGDGTFGGTTSITVGADQYVSFVAVGDVNNDGKLDLAVASTAEDQSGKLTVFLGNGSGGFTKSAQGTISTGGGNACWVGIAQITNGDTNPDIVVSNFGNSDQGKTTVTGNNIAIFQGDGTGAFNSIGAIANGLAFIPTALAIADFNGDGNLDIAATVPGVPPDSTSDQPNGSVEIFTGNGAGGFAVGNKYDSGGALPISIRAADLDGDSKPDLVVANAGNPDANSGYANFGSNSSIGVLMNTGGANFNSNVLTAGFGASGSKSAFAVTVADFDLDGKLDIAAILYGNPLNGANARVLEYKGNGAGGFAADANSPFNTTVTGGQYLAVADLNRDSVPDIVAVTDSSKLSVLLNTSTASTATATATALATSGSPADVGQSVTFTATVTSLAGTPSGTVAFKDGASTLGTGTLNAGGIATFSTSALAAGSHTITALYAANGGFAGSASSGLSQLVNAYATTTTLGASGSPSPFGSSVTFTATVASASGKLGGTPGGTVAFLDSGSALGFGTLDASGVATFSTTSLGVSTHSITAQYGANGNFAGSTSAALSHQVTPAATSTALATSGSPSEFGSSVAFTATVASSAGTPGGTVTFLDGGSTLGTGSLNASGVATFSTSSLGMATHSITAQYGANGNFAGSASSALTQQVNAAATSTAIATSGSPSSFGASVAFTATVASSAGTPGGTVTFLDGGSTLGTGTLIGGVATFSTTSLSRAAHSITARFAANGNFAASTSAALNQQVDPAATSTSLAASGGSSSFGSSVAFTVTVASSAGTPGGTVTFLDGGSPLGIGTLDGAGVATFNTSSLAVGTHAIAASYGGAAQFAGSTSLAIAHAVNKVATALALGVGANPAPSGQAVTFTAQIAPVVAAAAPTGTVAFLLGGVTLGTVPAGAGPVTFATRALPAGTSTITAVYSGDASYATSSAAAVVAVATAPPPLLVGYPQFAVGAGAGGSGTARFYNPDGTWRFDANVFPGFAGGVRVTSADFNGDGVADIVAGTGPGGPSEVRILDGKDLHQLFDAAPFEPAFVGGVYVTTGDLTGDGVPDLIVTPDEGGGPRCLVYDGKTFKQLASFFGIDDSQFRGGARSAVSDLNGDGIGDLVVAAGFGGGPRVAGYSGSDLGKGQLVKVFPDFFAFEETLRNGVFIAAADLNGDGIAEIIAGGGPGGGPRVTAFSGVALQSGQYVPILNFFGGNPDNRGGVRVVARNLNNDKYADLVIGDGTDAGSHVTGYSGKDMLAGNQTALFSFDAFPGFMGGVYVG